MSTFSAVSGALVRHAQRRRAVMIVVSTSLLALLIGCGGGGGGSKGAQPDSDACDLLGLNTRIINGTACNTAASAVLPISLTARNGQHALCSGTALSNRHILTAAHCFIETGAIVASVQVRDRRVFVKRVSIHPQVSAAPDGVGLINDVAVLELDERISVPTLPILVSRGAQTNDIFAIFGYGLDEHGAAGQLRSGEMKIQRVTGDHIIAEFDGPGSTTCNGDSGGPAVYDADGGPALIGVTSSGSTEDCVQGDVAYFVDLQSPIVLNFIQSTVPDLQLE